MTGMECPIRVSVEPAAEIATADVGLDWPAGSDAKADLIAQAHEFVVLAAEEAGEPPARQRFADIAAEVLATGTYTHTTRELEIGAMLAWRNHARCIGRLHWRALKVLDARDATTADQVFDACVEHLEVATNGGNLSSVVTAFAPRRPDGREIRIWNSQLIRYAGYRQADGTVVGDPMNADLTDAIARLGWRGDGGRFDLLPLVVQMPDEEPRMFELPRSAVLEVELTHPDLPWFVDLGLRWHALPAISDMRMEIGGLSYPACPFNGWYVSFEIGARNLSDEYRYNLLPEVATRMGLDTSRPATLWKDRALLELNHAVLHSFAEADVKIVDHHTASKQFVVHEEREIRAGREVPADWRWMVPPISGSTCPTFHRDYESADLRPNFYYQDQPWRPTPTAQGSGAGP